MTGVGRRARTVLVGVLALALAGCTHGAPTGGVTTGRTPVPATSSTTAGAASATAGSAATAQSSSATSTTLSGVVPGDDASWCSEIRRDWPDIAGRTVRIAADVTAEGGAALGRSWQDFETCTGAVISLEPTTRVPESISSGNPPDIAVLTQPYRFASLAAASDIVAAPVQVVSNIDTYFGSMWKAVGSVDGTVYAVPLGVTVQSLVWYSPAMFAKKGYQVPRTWPEMLALSDTIVASGQTKPWCAGTAAGSATGRSIEDWLAEAVLRKDGPAVYDGWVAGRVPYSDPSIAAALATVGQILKSPRYVNGGTGGVASILTTPAAGAGLPILSGTCYLMQAGQDYRWPSGTTVGPDADVDAFYLPPIGTSFGKPVVVRGSFATALNADPATTAALFYLSTAHWANNAAAASVPGISPNRGLRPDSVKGPLDGLALRILDDPQAVVRFDASDVMPAEVGAAAAPTQLAAWIAGQDDASTLAGIAQAWPKGTG